MNIIELKDQIMKNNLSNLYIFVGEEIGIMNIYLKQMSTKLGMEIIRANSVLSIYSRCTTRSMFGATKGFYVIRDDKDIMKQEKTYETLSEDIKDNVIILVYDKIDSRLKFGKYFADKTVKFEKLATSVLENYIEKASKLSNKNCKWLGEICGGSYDLAMLEIDKISHYANAIKCDTDKALEDLVEQGVIYQPEERDVFIFSQAVCSHKPKEAFEIEQILRENGVQSINILGTLYNSIKSVMLIQCCNDKDIASVTGLDKGAIYYNRPYVGKWETWELVHAVKTIAQTVEGIKSGWIDDVYSVRYVLVNIF